MRYRLGTAVSVHDVFHDARPDLPLLLPRNAGGLPLKFLSRAVVVGLASWGLLLGISPDWPLGVVALASAAAVELILWLYRYEAGGVTPVRARWIVGLRLAALAALVWILIEPVWVRKVEREIKREVVVVVDDSGSMQLKDDGADATRIAIGEAALAKGKIVEKLGDKLRMRVVKAARSVRAEGEAVAEGWGDATDLASALGTVLEQVPPDELAGVLMVSDGRHNRPERVEDVARRFGILDRAGGDGGGGQRGAATGCGDSISPRTRGDPPRRPDAGGGGFEIRRL